MGERITSRKNAVICEIRALRQKKHRDARREFVVEGARAVSDAFSSGAWVKRLLVSDAFVQQAHYINMAAAAGIGAYVATPEAFAAAAGTESPQGVLCVCGQPKWDFAALFAAPSGFFLLCDRVSDPGNLGTLIRSAAAFSCRGVLLSEGCVDPYNEKVVRATMGTIFSTPVLCLEDTGATVVDLKAHGVQVLVSALGQGASGTMESVDIGRHTCIVVGNEACGVRPELLHLADGILEIPMPGRAESLNAAVAGSILLYEAAKKYGLM